MASAHRNDVSQAEILLWTGGLLGTTSWKMIWKLRPWLWSFREKWYPLSKLFPIWWTHTFNSDWIIEIFYNSAAKGKPTRNSVIDKDLSNRGKTNWKLMKIKEWTFENSVHLHQFLSLFIFLHFILSLFFSRLRLFLLGHFVEKSAMERRTGCRRKSTRYKIDKSESIYHGEMIVRLHLLWLDSLVIVDSFPNHKEDQIFLNSRDALRIIFNCKHIFMVQFVLFF